MSRPPSGKKCGARSKRTGKQCGQPAMRGQRVCRMHGGKTPKGTDAPAYKHGLYSRWAPKQLAEKIEAMRADTAKLTDLLEVLPVQHALLAQAMEQLTRAEEAQDIAAIVACGQAILTLTDTISRNIQRFHELIHGRKIDLTVRPDLSKLTDEELEILERLLSRCLPVAG